MAAPIYKTKVLAAADDNGICLSQTPLAGGNLTIAGVFATAGVATLDTQRRVLFTFASDETGRTFVVYGTMDSGAAIQEAVAGAAATAVTTQDFKTVTRITIDAGSAGAIIVGTNGVGSTPWQIVNWDVSPMEFGMAGLVGGTVNYTFQFSMEDPSGTYPNPNPATSGYVNTAQPSRQITEFPTAFDITDLASKSADTAATWTRPIAAWRVVINSGTDPVTAVVLQSGLAG